MRSFSLSAFAALFLVVVVSAAPQHASDAVPSVRDVIYELKSIFACVPGAVGETIGEGGFKPEYVQFAQYFDAVLKSLPKCAELKSTNQKYNCVEDSIRKLDQVYAGLIEKLSMKDKAVAEKVQTDLKGKCIKHPASVILKEFECNTNALEEASTNSGMTTEWKKFETKFQQHHDAWKHCVYPFCNLTEIGYVYSLSIQYVETAQNHPNFEKFYENLKMIMVNCA